MRNREVCIGQPRAPVAEVMKQRTFGFLGGIQRAPRLAIDTACVLKILAHELSGREYARYGTLGQVLLGFKALQVLVAAGAIMQKTATRIKQSSRQRQARRSPRIGSAQ